MIPQYGVELKHLFSPCYVMVKLESFSMMLVARCVPGHSPLRSRPSDKLLWRRVVRSENVMIAVAELTQSLEDLVEQYVGCSDI